MTGRKLLQTAVAFDRLCNGSDLSHIKIILGVNYDEEVPLVKELCAWGFFGFNHENIVIVTIPCFPGVTNVSDSDLKEQVMVAQ